MKPCTTPARAAPPKLSGDHALFLDFDGTLAPIQDDPDTVTLTPDRRAFLLRLASQRAGALAVVSGRDIRDLTTRVPQELWRAGGHGLDICSPGEIPIAHQDEAPQDLRRRLDSAVGGFPGARIELKGPVVAVHYRSVPDAGPRLSAAMETIVQDTEDYGIQHGKMVIELKPNGANKGEAIKKLLAGAPFAGRVPVMVGDDTTDEDAMRAAAEHGGFGVKVGDGPTCAEYALADPGAVWRWLRDSTP